MWPCPKNPHRITYCYLQLYLLANQTVRQLVLSCCPKRQVFLTGDAVSLIIKTANPTTGRSEHAMHAAYVAHPPLRQGISTANRDDGVVPAVEMLTFFYPLHSGLSYKSLLSTNILVLSWCPILGAQ